MVSLRLRKMLSVAAAVAIACVATSVMSAATSNPVIYTAAGTFGPVPLSGADTLKLSGEPFNIMISADTNTAPAQHGSNWAVYTNLKMSGQVYSALLGAAPQPIQSQHAQLQLTTGPTNDIVTATFVVDVIGIAIKIQAKVYVPSGTLANPKIGPFPTVSMIPSPSTPNTGTQVTYADSTAATILTIASGTLGAAYPTGAAANLFPAGSPSDLLAVARIPDFSPVLVVRKSNYFPAPEAL
jgi:hypothetical protein